MKIILLVMVIFSFLNGKAMAEDNKMKYDLAWESTPVLNIPFALMTAGDLDGNGIKEIAFTDFSYMSRSAEDNPAKEYHFMIYEWTGKELDGKTLLKFSYA